MTTTPPFPTLTTERLILREVVTADAAELFEIHGDADLMRWFGSDPLQGIEGAQALVNTFANWRTLANPGVRWALQLKGESKLIGTCGLFGWNRNWRKCTIGYELSRAAQGKGLMQEALITVLNWGFQHMELNRVEAQVHPANAASIQSVRRLGFHEEGRLREAGHWGGQFHDLLQFSLLRKEWEAKQTCHV